MSAQEAWEASSGPSREPNLSISELSRLASERFDLDARAAKIILVSPKPNRSLAARSFLIFSLPRDEIRLR